MKTGLRLYYRYRLFLANLSLCGFWIRKKLIGFDVANNYIQRVDKYSILRILKKNGARIGNNCEIETGVIFHNCKGYSNLSIGDNCHIGKNCFLDLKDKVTIGNNVTISMQSSIFTHLDLGKSTLKNAFPNMFSPVTIGDNVYLGGKCTILAGVTIYSCSFIGAFSLVNRDVPENTLVVGNPARKIRDIDS